MASLSVGMSKFKTWAKQHRLREVMRKKICVCSVCVSVLKHRKQHSHSTFLVLTFYWIGFFPLKLRHFYCSCLEDEYFHYFLAFKKLCDLNYSVILLCLVDVRVTDVVTVSLQIFKAARINPESLSKNISKWEMNKSK